MTNKKLRLCTGDEFMTGTTIEQLQDLHKKEKNANAAYRLLACIHRKSGMMLYDIAKMLNKAPSTVHTWLVRMNERGPEGRYHNKHPGAACKLNPEQLASLKKDLIEGPKAGGFESGVWTAPLLVEHVKRKYGVQYEDSGMIRLLHRMGFSCRKPRPRHPKAATKEEIEDFKKEAQKDIADYSQKGYTILAGDECSHILGWNIKNGWYPKNNPVTTPISLSRQRFYSFGALSQDDFYCAFYDKANGTNFLNFLTLLYDKYGKFVIYLDSASYHKSKEVLRYVEKKFGDNVRLEFILKYTPELNPVEGQWRITKKHTANSVYESIDEMKKSIRKMLDNGEIKVAKMFDYLGACA